MRRVRVTTNTTPISSTILAITHIERIHIHTHTHTHTHQHTHHTILTLITTLPFTLALTIASTIIPPSSPYPAHTAPKTLVTVLWVSLVHGFR